MSCIPGRGEGRSQKNRGSFSCWVRRRLCPSSPAHSARNALVRGKAGSAYELDPTQCSENWLHYPREDKWARCQIKHCPPFLSETPGRRPAAVKGKTVLQETTTRFLLFPGETETSCQIQLHALDTLQQCAFNASRPLVMIIHGWAVGNADMPFLSAFHVFLPRLLTLNQ